MNEDKRLRPGSVSSSDVQQLLVVKEEVSPEWSSSLDEEDPEPLHIKEEQEELWTGQEGDQLNRLKEADMTRFPFIAVTVKSEDDEEKPQCSQLHQSQTEDNRETEPPASSSATHIKTETDEEDCGGSEPARNGDPDSHPQLNTDEKASDCSETDVSSDNWQEPLSDSGPETKESDSGSEETRAPELGLNAPKYMETPGSDENLETHTRVPKGDEPFCCDVCGKRFTDRGSLRRHMRVHAGVKPFSCDVCGKRFIQQGHLETHMRVHTGEKPFCCCHCGKGFTEQGNLNKHMRVHTGEKPYGCGDCGKRFTHQGGLKRHMRVHTGEKPFVCDDCGTRYSFKTNLVTHMRVHTGVRPFGCDVCGTRFSLNTNLKKHMRVHTGEKPFGCDVCGNRFTERGSLRRHVRVHTGEKPFGCVVCGKRFTQQGTLKTHMSVHSGQKCSVAGFIVK
ncbi:uncharacterized protein [Pagrus major]|uniref:uncharacterized protein n=1 Tax=Pagrus major TaxID=143350 RepID=UPI003CC8DF10